MCRSCATATATATATTTPAETPADRERPDHGLSRRRLLAADGQVGPATWPVLVYPLRQGASGSPVRALQTALNRRGARLAVDGGFGSVTTSAVRAYQSGNRLVADGEAARRPGGR